MRRRNRKMSRKELLSKARGENRRSFSKEIDSAQAEPIETTGGAFELGVVEEVISDPYEYFGKPWPEEPPRTFGGKPVTIGDVYSGRVEFDDNDVPFRPSPYKNKRMVDFAPPNSTKVFLKRAQKSSTSMESILCFPFFSSHLMQCSVLFNRSALPFMPKEYSKYHIQCPTLILLHQIHAIFIACRSLMRIN